MYSHCGKEKTKQKKGDRIFAAADISYLRIIHRKSTISAEIYKQLLYAE